MLLDGINHVALLTSDTDRLTAFYGEMFEATVDGTPRPGVHHPPGTPSRRYHP